MRRACPRAESRKCIRLSFYDRNSENARMLLLIDNYDSFTYNLVHYLGELGARCAVLATTRSRVDEALALQARGDRDLARPLHAERGRHLPRRCQGRAGPQMPILGVCLGHQAIGQAFGGKVVRAPTLMHGKLSPINHDGTGRVRRPAVAVHRDALPLADRRADLPPTLEVNAETDDGDDHGPAPQDAADPRRAVPPREHRLRARPPDPREFPAASPATTRRSRRRKRLDHDHWTARIKARRLLRALMRAHNYAHSHARMSAQDARGPMR